MRIEFYKLLIAHTPQKLYVIVRCSSFRRKPNIREVLVGGPNDFQRHIGRLPFERKRQSDHESSYDNLETKRPINKGVLYWMPTQWV